MTKHTKKPKISKVKRGNQQRNKLARQGKLKTRRNKKPVQKQQTVKPAKRDSESEDEKAGSEDDAADMLRMVDDEDLAFLKSAVQNRSYSLLNRIRKNVPKEKEKLPKGKRKAPEDDSPVEFKYQKWEEPDAKKTRYLLPIKTKDGLVMRTEEVEVKEVEVEEEEEKEKGEVKKEKEDDNSDVEYVLEDGEIPGLDVEQELSEADLLAYREQLLNKRRMQIGLLSSGLLESPEMKIKNFKILLAMLDEERPEIQLSVRKLVLLSLLELFKDLLPAYQIKHQDQPGVKVKKDTFRLQQFEKSLLKAYKMYLQQLERFAGVLRRPRGGDSSARDPRSQRLGELALRCMGELLTTHPYFNFARNVAQLLAAQLAHPRPGVRAVASSALRAALRADRRGELSLHITRCISRLTRARAAALPPDALAPLLALRLKDVDLDREKAEELKQRRIMTHRQKLLKLSRSQRKHSRLQEQLDKELMEAKAEENKQMKHKLLTEVTKTLFTIYFRVLKSEPGSPLLSATLEGLAHFAHCINMDFYHDLVNALDQLLAYSADTSDGPGPALGLHQRLLCTQTVFSLLSGQGEALSIDPQRFYTHLYGCLLEVHAGRTSPELQLVLRTAELALLGRHRHLSQQRLLAFIKRLATLATQQLAGGAVGCLGALRSLLATGQSRLGGGTGSLLEPDPATGEGVYRPDLTEPEYCCAGATALWELPLLARHFHPTVRRLARATSLRDPEAALAAVPADLAHLRPVQLLQRFDCSKMSFHPPVQPPPPASAGRRRHTAVQISCPELKRSFDEVMVTLPRWDPAFGEELLSSQLSPRPTDAAVS